MNPVNVSQIRKDHAERIELFNKANSKLQSDMFNKQNDFLEGLKNTYNAIIIFQNAFINSELVKSISKLSKPTSINVQSFTAFSERVIKAIDTLTEKQKTLATECIENGWYPIPEFPLTFAPRTESFELEMCQAVEGSLEAIEQRVCLANPQRSKIIRAAFAAHRREEYELSIPCLFPQAEGICCDVIEVCPFQKKGGELLKERTNFSDTDFSSIFFSPLIEANTIREQTSRISNDDLNRHLVMHGISTTCFTKVNSLKLISFIGCLDFFLDEYRGKKSNPTIENENI